MKRVVALVAALLCCTSSVFAWNAESFTNGSVVADESLQSVTLDYTGFSNSSVGGNPFVISYVEQYRRVTSSSVSDYPEYFSSSYGAQSPADFIKASSGSTFSFSYILNNFSAPPYYHGSDTTSASTSYYVPYFDISSQNFRVYTGVYLDPGIYEVTFASRFFLDWYCSAFSSVPVSVDALSYTYFFQDSAGNTIVPFYSDDKTKVFVELDSRSHLLINVAFSGSSFANGRHSYTEAPIGYRFRMYNPFLTYSTIDSLSLNALSDATDSSNNSQQSYDDFESQWTGSMTENFNSLDLEDFTFPDGLISAFALITGIFNDLWNALGEYKILFVFPLCLGIVLLLIGRISKFDFSDRSGGSGGSGPPAVI